MPPPAAHSTRWCVWRASAGIRQPGMTHPRSRMARARRWATVAARLVRPTARGTWPSSGVSANPAIRADIVVPAPVDRSASMRSRPQHGPASSATIGVTSAAQATNRCSEPVSPWPRLVVQAGTPALVRVRVTVSATGRPPRAGRASAEAAEVTRATSPSARRAAAGTWSAALRSFSAQASTAAMTASPSRRGRLPVRTTESPRAAKERNRLSWASASSGVGSSGGWRVRITRWMNLPSDSGVCRPHWSDSCSTTADISSSVSPSARRARASPCSPVMIPAAHGSAIPGCAAANAPARVSRLDHPADQYRASTCPRAVAWAAQQRGRQHPSGGPAGTPGPPRR